MKQAVSAESAGKTVNGVFLRLGSAKSAPITSGTSLVLADTVDEALGSYLDGGGKCILLSYESKLRAGRGVAYSYYYYFRTIPWNGGRGNSGTVIARAPAFAAFPHEGMCDLQFIQMVSGWFPIDIGPLRKYGVVPLIRAIDHYQYNNNNAYALEFGVGRGKALVTSLGILQNASTHVEAGNMLACLLDYAAGKQFAPAGNVPAGEFVRLLSQGE